LIDGAAALAIGIDVGGTKIAAGLLDPATGATAGERAIPARPERGGAAILEDCAALAADLRAAAPGSIAAIGIGLPELVDPAGRPASAETVDWRALGVAATFRHIAPVRMEADVRAAALAEGRFGAGRSFGHWIYLSIGTGISSAIVTGGVPMTGARGAALVLSSGPVSIPDPVTGEPFAFTLEPYSSGAGIARRWQEASGDSGATTESALAAAESGHAVAGRIVRTAAIALGSAIGWLANVTDPEAIVLGGGLGTAGGVWADQLMTAIRSHIWNPAARGLPILPAALGPSAGWIGAALAATVPAAGAGREVSHPARR
jgi:glucokinase